MRFVRRQKKGRRKIFFRRIDVCCFFLSLGSICCPYTTRQGGQQLRLFARIPWANLGPIDGSASRLDGNWMKCNSFARLFALRAEACLNKSSKGRKRAFEAPRSLGLHEKAPMSPRQLNNTLIPFVPGLTRASAEHR